MKIYKIISRNKLKAWDEADYRLARFEFSQKQVNPNIAAHLVAEQAPVASEDHVVFCDGGNNFVNFFWNNFYQAIVMGAIRKCSSIWTNQGHMHAAIVVNDSSMCMQQRRKIWKMHIYKCENRPFLQNIFFLSIGIFIFDKILLNYYKISRITLVLYF